MPATQPTTAQPVSIYSAAARMLRLAEQVEINGATYFEVDNAEYALSRPDLFVALTVTGRCPIRWVLTPAAIIVRDRLLA